jgi:hypothetical protein
MYPSQLVSTLVKCVNNDLPVLLKGAPGIGKTDICNQVGEITERQVITVIPAICDPTDGKGVPGKNGKGKWEWHLIGDARRVIEATKPMLVVIDDLGQAPATVQASFMQWILLRRIGEHDIPDCVTFIAATNRRQDRAGVTGILEPVKSRFVTILELTPNIDDWVTWAFTHEMPGQLIAFAHFRPTMLTAFKPVADIVNGPCPRTFANAGKLLNAGISDMESIAGAVGEGCAVEMLGFFKYWQQLPNLAAVIADPDKADVPTEPAALYAIVTGLVEKATKTNIGRIFKYGARLPKDFNILLGRDCIRRDASIQNTTAFIKWAVDNKDILAA